MANLADPLEAAILQRFFFQTPLIVPATLDLALFSSAPDDAGLGGTELTGGNYARKPVSLTAANWSYAAGVISNSVSITTNTASADWVEATHYILYNSTVPWFVGSLVTPATILSGSAYTIPVGDLDLVFGGALTDFGKQKFAEYIFREVTVLWPDFVDISLTSTAPTAAAEGTELTGSGYARMIVQLDNTLWSFDSALSQMSNGIPLTWGKATANWSAIAGLNYYTALSSDRWMFTVLGSTVLVITNNQANFPEGGLRFKAQ